MGLYRIWIDDKRHNEAEDGEDFNGTTASDAVAAFATERYSDFQHLDPGRVLVRYPNGGSVVRWFMRSRVEIDVGALEIVEDNGDGA